MLKNSFSRLRPLVVGIIIICLAHCVGRKLIHIILRISSIILFIFPIIGFAQNNTDFSLAKVNKVSGKYVFLNCEPVNDYEVIYEVKVTPVHTAQVSSLDKISNIVLKKAFKMKKKQGEDFDAIIIGNSRVDLAVRFKQ